MVSYGTRCRMSEPPFRPIQKLREKQRYFQSVPKYTYLKGPHDKITSVAIPLALTASSIVLLVSSFLKQHFIQIVCPYTYENQVRYVIELVFRHWSRRLIRVLFGYFVQCRGIYIMSHGIGKKESWKQGGNKRAFFTDRQPEWIKSK